MTQRIQPRENYFPSTFNKLGAYEAQGAFE